MYFRDGDSYRSPWSNVYFPYISDGYHPSIQLRAIEEELNTAFKVHLLLLLLMNYVTLLNNSHVLTSLNHVINPSDCNKLIKPHLKL